MSIANMRKIFCFTVVIISFPTTKTVCEKKKVLKCRRNKRLGVLNILEFHFDVELELYRKLFLALLLCVVFFFEIHIVLRCCYINLCYCFFIVSETAVPH